MLQVVRLGESYYQEAIIFDDLSRAVQERVLHHVGIKDPREVHWDIFPLLYSYK